MTEMATPAERVLDLAVHDRDIVELKGASKRVDWLVRPAPSVTPADAPGFVKAFRRFLADFDAEIDARAGDPIATGQALAKVETIAADIRYVASRLRTVTAEAMDTLKVRRIVAEQVGVWEASSTVDRRDWDHGTLVDDFLTARGVHRVMTVDGEIVPIGLVSRLVGELYGPSTAPRLTPLRAAGLDPDDYCTVATDEDGKIVRTPTVTVRVNEERRVIR